MKSRALGGLLVLTANVGLFGCVTHPAAIPTVSPAPDSGVVVHFTGATAPLIIGRAAHTEKKGIRIAWPGTAATVTFHGSAVSVDITDTGDNHYLVLVDGEPQEKKLRPTEGRATVPLVTGLPTKEHSVTLYKLTEPLVGTATIHGFVLDESARPVALASHEKKRLEIIGDSISAGYGNEGADETCGFSPETENHYLTYGALAARELKADLTTIAWSGKGVFSNRGSTTDRDTLPVLWERTLPSENVAYDFKDAPPDAVVINLGTNDFAPEVPDFSSFGPSYDAFVESVRKRYPDTHLFVMLGPLLTDGYPEGRQALTKARAALTEIVKRRAAAGDSKLYFFEVDHATPEEGFGCDYHPSAKTHARMARTLARELRDKAHF